MFRLSKFINGQLMWAIGNIALDRLIRDMSEIMMEMKSDPRLSLSVEAV